MRCMEMGYKNKDLPVLYETKEQCCGCTACYAGCPVHAIEMKPDTEGFFYPVIDDKKCIRCYHCIAVCTFKDDQKKRYGVQHEV